MKQPARRSIPSVEKTLQALGDVGLPRPVVVAIVRRELAALRSQEKIPDSDRVVARLRATLWAFRQSRIQPIINGTGIVLHTNLGRAPLAPAAVETLRSIAPGYSNLEYDLLRGERGNRAAYLEHNLALLCGAQAATVVNNCAAALVLILRHLVTSRRDEVVISRGELVQIGGGFRIPEILEASGARLREVGTTNKTSLGDYARAIRRETALILKVHRSNFFMSGFVESPATEEIGKLARKHRIPFVEDLGSGAVLPTEKLAGVEHEPTPAEILRHGVDLVCFSGDKLLGGPQAGIIAGPERRIAALKRDPFFRALRCDKLILGALQTTVDLSLGGGGGGESIPVQAMLCAPEEALRARAESVIAALGKLPLAARVGRGHTQIGGGALPRSRLPSITIDLHPSELSLTELASRLRQQTPPVIGFISGAAFRLDLRTVFPGQDADLIRALRSVLDPPG
ncbi:MAG TPA: L-seryl-tRNA(Sec) selenium transferase [Candidatus Binatia bacterium]|nr:L-seryl-tRNA(Sec) selenium transferase [Candidatus Binatia bacterium]